MTGPYDKELVESKLPLESVSRLNIIERIEVSDDEPPEVSKEESDHEHNHCQPEDFEYEHHYMLRLHPIGSGGVLEVALDKSFEPVGVDEAGELRKPEETNEFGVEHVLARDPVEGESGYEVKDKPALQIVLCNLLNLPYLLK